MQQIKASNCGTVTQVSVLQPIKLKVLNLLPLAQMDHRQHMLRNLCCQMHQISTASMVLVNQIYPCPWSIRTNPSPMTRTGICPLMLITLARRTMAATMWTTTPVPQSTRRTWNRKCLASIATWASLPTTNYTPTSGTNNATPRSKSS